MQVRWAEAEVSTSCVIHEHHTSRDTDILTLSMQHQVHSTSRPPQPADMLAACVYAGFSRGGYSAAALASRSPEATHALVMHSAVTTNQARHDGFCSNHASEGIEHVHPSYFRAASADHSVWCGLQIGTHVVPIRFSTGNRDPMFTYVRIDLLPIISAQLLYLRSPSLVADARSELYLKFPSSTTAQHDICTDRMLPSPCSKAAGNHEGLEAYPPQDKDPPAGIQGQPPDGAAGGVRGQREVVADRRGAVPKRLRRQPAGRRTLQKCKLGHTFIVLSLTCMAVPAVCLI